MFCLRTAALFLLIGITLGSHAPYYDLADAEQHFANFINRYEKKYESVDEFRQRFDIFKRNLNKLNEWNAQYKHENGGYVVTQFSDQEGYQSCVDFSKMSNTTKKHRVKREFILNAPNKIDYREHNFVTGIKNQAHCGSCYIFSAIGNIEGMHSKKSGELVSLSEQQVMDCAMKKPCNGGWPDHVMNALASHGSMAEADYTPYHAAKGNCSEDPKKVKVKVIEGHRIDTPDVETMKGALVENGAPLSVAFYASPELMYYVGSDVLNPKDCYPTYDVNHAIVLVGYNADPASGKRPHWIIKNSWGTEHGDHGYHYLDFEAQCSFGSIGTATSSVA